MTERVDVVVAGHLCLDIIPSIEEERLAFTPGRLLEIGPAVLSTGGPVSNTGLALHKLGISTRLMGKVGRDAFGRIVRDIVAARGPELTEGMIEVAGETTSYSLIVSPRGTDRMFLHCPGCNDTFVSADIDYSMVARARLFHFGYPPLLRSVIDGGGAELRAVFERAKAAGATTSLDMSMPDPNSFSGRIDWPAVLSATLPRVDIFLPSFEETLFTLYPEIFRRAAAAGALAAAPDPALVQDIGAHLLEMGPAVVGLKLGTLRILPGDGRGRGLGGLRTRSPRAVRCVGGTRTLVPLLRNPGRGHHRGRRCHHRGLPRGAAARRHARGLPYVRLRGRWLQRRGPRRAQRFAHVGRNPAAHRLGLAPQGDPTSRARVGTHVLGDLAQRCGYRAAAGHRRTHHTREKEDNVTRVLAFMSHPDDAEILIGGTLFRLKAAGWTVGIATMTPGDCGSSTETREGIARIRLAEAEAAATLLGATYRCAGLKDLEVFANIENLRSVVEVMRAFAPDVVIAHSPADYMLDHEEASRLVRGATFAIAVPLFDTLRADPAPITRATPALYYADPVEGIDASGQRVIPQFYVDISGTMDDKRRMLAMHRSQRDWLRHHHGVDEYLNRVTSWAARYGPESGVAYAEGLRQYLAHGYPHEPVIQSALGIR